MPNTMFYNPRIACLGIGVSVVTNSIQLEIAKSLNPQQTGRVQKGQKVYDWENKAFYGLTPDECYLIDKAIPLIATGKYKDPNASDPKYAHIFTITHFRENKPSRFSLQQAMDKNKNPLPTCTITLKPPGGATGFYYPLRVEEFAIFGWFIRNGFQRLPFEGALIEAKEKKARRDAWEEKNKPQDNKQSAHTNTEDGEQFPDSAPDTPPDAPPDAPSENVTSVDSAEDVPFNF